MTVSRETVRELQTRPRPAEVLEWLDGDTVKLRVDLGFGTSQEIDVRLLDYDAPEGGEPGHAEARGRAEQLAPVGSWVIFRSFKPKARSFARWLGHVYVDHEGNRVSVALTLKDEKLSKSDFA